MNNFFRAIIAGYGAKKLGGGCFGTILVFVLIWVALGQCSFSSREVPPPESYPGNRRAHIPLQLERNRLPTIPVKDEEMMERFSYCTVQRVSTQGYRYCAMA